MNLRLRLQAKRPLAINRKWPLSGGAGDGQPAIRVCHKCIIQNSLQKHSEWLGSELLDFSERFQNTASTDGSRRGIVVASCRRVLTVALVNTLHSSPVLLRDGLVAVEDATVRRADIFERLRLRGWTVEERPDYTLRLPQEVAARHPELPTPLCEFLGGLIACEDKSQTAWFLCEGDYCGTSGAAFRWDEWERMSLVAADGDADVVARVRDFWDSHLPFLLSVRDGYAYYAVRTKGDGFGWVVAGREPEFEETSVVAQSFDQFLMGLVNEDV